jgi:predicted transcriptional regulator|tara:strand:+ start:458 stop:631 length:174 start_codon:yes stop_codon:yes gene_type:complete
MKKSNSPYSTIAVRHEVHARLKKLAQKRYQSITKLIEQLVELEETREKSGKRRGVYK